MGEILSGVLILLAAFMVIPAAGFAATDSWRGAWQAVREYLLIMLGFVAVGGGAGLLAVLAEHGPAVIWQLLTGR